MTVTTDDLAELLRRARLEAGLTQAQLAAMTGQPQAVVCEREHGRRLSSVVEAFEHLGACGWEIRVRGRVLVVAKRNPVV